MIIGGARCGTTALYNFLRKHPQVYFPSLKEPRYYSSMNQNYPHNGPGDYSVDRAIVKDKNTYLELFKNTDKKLIGDASPDYLYFHTHVAEKIKSDLGNIKIIIILREPASRAYSAYNHLVRDNREKYSFHEALEKEESRIQENYDFMWYYKDVGLYFQQVSTYKHLFENVHIIIQEDLKNNPRETMNILYKFLEIDEYHQIDYNISYNKVGMPKGVIAKFILNRNNVVSVWFREAIKMFVPRTFLEWISEYFIQSQNIDPNDLVELKKYYKSEVEKLENMLGYKIELWK